MNKYIIASLSIVIAGFIIFIVGLILSNFILSITGGVMIILPILILKIGEYKEKRKSLLEYMENKDKSLLPLPKTNLKKRLNDKRIMSMLMSLFITAIIFAFITILLKNYVLGVSDIDLDKAIKDGCAKLNMGGTCITDPSKIIVPYDVNKDGIKGGVDDTLTNLLKMYNCTDSCIRKRCGCPA